MVNENIIPKTETIYELKEEYKVPSFEEFMKTYESDGNLNYDDLSGGDIGTPKGYGPTRFLAEHVTYSFHLRIECYNWDGFGETVEVNDISEAWRQIDRLRNGSWNCSGWISNSVLNKCADLVLEAVGEGLDRRVNGYVRVQGRFWGGYECKWEY